MKLSADGDFCSVSVDDYDIESGRNMQRRLQAACDVVYCYIVVVAGDDNLACAADDSAIVSVVVGYYVVADAAYLVGGEYGEAVGGNSDAEFLSLIHISEPTILRRRSSMPSYA